VFCKWRKSVSSESFRAPQEKQFFLRLPKLFIGHHYIFALPSPITLGVSPGISRLHTDFT
jgi:hypothetical protein